MEFDLPNFMGGVSAWLGFYGAAWMSQVFVRFLKDMFDASVDASS